MVGDYKLPKQKEAFSSFVLNISVFLISLSSCNLCLIDEI